MAKSQLKQNQLYLIKLKIGESKLSPINHNWEIIQPQFSIGQPFLVFDKRKFKKT